jgi:hypothetical protein
MRISFCSLAVVLLFHIALPVARAQDDGQAKISASDVEKYLKVEEARALADARKDFTRDPVKRTELDNAREQAIKQSGLTPERFEEISSTINTIVDALRQEAAGGDDAASAKETLASMHKDSIAVVKAKQKELSDSNGRSERAQAKAKEEFDAEKRGTPPDPAKLEGTWKFDVDATIDAMGFKPEGEQLTKLRQDLLKTESSYTFGPGNTIVSTSKQSDGKERSDKGTYRLEGNKVFFKTEGRNRERDMTVGMKGDHLVITMMGMGLHFKKH